MNTTPRANRTHISFFGRRNAGKSSLVNAVTGQALALVSEVKGTTTDPVYKAMELLPLGPVVIIDTPGFDDEGELGTMRVNKAKQVLDKTDIAILVFDVESQPDTLKAEKELFEIIKSKNIPYLIVINKCDLDIKNTKINSLLTSESVIPLSVSAKTGQNIDTLKEKISELTLKDTISEKKLVSDLISPLDFVVLVIPIDDAAPKGRLILPQQQVIREIIEIGASAITVRDTHLSQTLDKLEKKPALVITDSQVFAQVNKIVPLDIPLTSFSILFARYKGFLDISVNGALILDTLNEGDKILICEGCTHHRQCDDIGTVKIPKMIKSHCSKDMNFTFCSGNDFPADLSSYKLIIHCGACMLNDREMKNRISLAEEQNIPFTNYGITIAHIQGILNRCIEILVRNEE